MLVDIVATQLLLLVLSSSLLLNGVFCLPSAEWFVGLSFVHIITPAFLPAPASLPGVMIFGCGKGARLITGYLRINFLHVQCNSLFPAADQFSNSVHFHQGRDGPRLSFNISGFSPSLYIRPISMCAGIGVLWET